MKNRSIVVIIILLMICTALNVFSIRPTEFPGSGNELFPGNKNVYPAPVTSSEHYNLMKPNSDAYWIKSGEVYANPVMIMPTVNAQDIYNYYNNNNESGRFTGLRFYPALQSNKMVLIMCLAEGPLSDTTKKAEKGYLALTKGHYLAQNTISITDSITYNAARTLNNNYMSGMYLYKNAPSTPNDSIRYSRYFAWEDIDSLVQQNKTSGVALSNYYLQLDIGYVTFENANLLRSRALVVYSTEYNQGFTVLMHVKDKSGVSILNPFSTYNDSIPTEKTNYVGRTLEVANPCPPRCGIIRTQ